MLASPGASGGFLERLLSETTGLCGQCKRTVPARLVARDGRAFLDKRCDAHGAQSALVSSNADWLVETLAAAPALSRPEAKTRVAQGCPYDCGPCDAHEQRLHLPVVPITSACNLDCPICYTHNKNGEGAWHMPEAELRAILDRLATSHPERAIVNITGGEPTLHPDFERLVGLCRAAGFKRVTISTHGLRFLKDEELLARLAALDARVILSFDSFEKDANEKLLGGDFLASKLRVLALLEKHRVSTTLLPVLARGYNDGELGRLLALALEKDFIRSVELHPMTFTGQYGAGFDRAARYTAYDALADVEAQSGGTLRIADFVPSPAAHPLCYQVAYLLRLGDGRFLPFTRFMSRPELRTLLSGTLYGEPGAEAELLLADVINRLWAGEIVCGDAPAVLAALRELSQALFSPDVAPADRLQVSESRTKAIYVHTHMDEETFDTDRIRQCCVGMPAADGTSIPSCAYNVLYRERDRRFMESPREPLVALGRGRVDPGAAA